MGRDPVDVVASLVVMNEHRTADAALRAYCRSYGRLRRHRDQFAVATFEQVVSDLDEVIDRLNAFSGTSYGRFRSRSERRDGCVVSDRGAATERGAVDELRVARLSSVRTMAAAQILTAVQAVRPTRFVLARLPRRVIAPRPRSRSSRKSSDAPTGPGEPDPVEAQLSE